MDHYWPEMKNCHSGDGDTGEYQADRNAEGEATWYVHQYHSQPEGSVIEEILTWWALYFPGGNAFARLIPLIKHKLKIPRQGMFPPHT